MAIQRSSLKMGPAKVTFNGGTFISKENIVPRFTRDWSEVGASLHGPIDRSETDRRIEIPVRLWGAYENLSILFPTTYLNPTIGARIYGDADVPLVVHGTDGEIFTFPNAQITRLANLHLGVDSSMFVADVIFTALIKNNANPEDADAYCVISSGAFSDATFAKTNYKQQRYSGAWSGVTGFTTMHTRLGWDIEWDLRLAPIGANGLGTQDMSLQGLVARARCIPIEPTQAQALTAARYGGSSNALGRLLSASAADLTITGTGVSIVLKSAGLMEHGAVFGGADLRNGEFAWESTRGFSAGVAAANATVG